MKALVLIVVGVAVGIAAAVFVQDRPSTADVPRTTVEQPSPAPGEPAPQANPPSPGTRVDRFVGELREEGREIGSRIREGVREARQKIDQMSIEGRVYARLRWDKQLNGASITVDVDKGGTAVLRGAAPNEAAKSKAAEIARDTVGVAEVRNDLAVGAAR